ncbi:MAG: hypothetical protein U9N53_11485 [Bacteroidota bacterium]|nr:hypothetical protein [Bacteroidota bacterium]
MEARRDYLLALHNNFAEKGPKALESEAGRKDYDQLLHQLLELHFEKIEIFCLACDEHCQKYPDLHLLLTKFPAGLKFHKQLFLNRTKPLYNLAFQKGISIIKQKTETLFSEYYELKFYPQESGEIWTTLVDAWFSRLDVNDLTAKSIHRMTDEIMNIILRFQKEIMEERSGK